MFSFNAPFYGSTGAMHLNQPIVGMVATRDRGGYWMVAADGGVFTFGDATFGGSGVAGSDRSPAVGIAANEAGNGYWVANEDGDVAAFGGAPGLATASPTASTVTICPLSAGGYVLVDDAGGTTGVVPAFAQPHLFETSPFVPAAPIVGSGCIGG